MSRRKPALAFIFIVLVLDVLGVGLIVPILPGLVSDLRGGTEAQGAVVYGWILGMYSLMQFIFAPILGSLSDRYGRRKVILISLLGIGLDYFLMAWAPTLLWFFLGRIIAGITGANFSAATAYIADVSPPEKRAANFGLVGAAFGFGFTVGPALGGLLANVGEQFLGENGIRLPFVVAGVLTLLNWLYGVFILPESLKPENQRNFSLRDSNPLQALLDLRKYPLVLGLAATYFLLNLGHQVFPAIWALFTEKRFDWGPWEIGLSLGLVGLMAIVVQGGVVRVLIPRLGERRAAVLGTSINICSLMIFGLAQTAGVVYAVIIVGALGGIATPAIQGLISRTVGDDEQGKIQGSLTSLQSVSGFLGPILMTSTYGFFVSENAPWIIPGAGFFLAALLTALGTALMLLSFRRIKPVLTGH